MQCIGRGPLCQVERVCKLASLSGRSGHLYSQIALRFAFVRLGDEEEGPDAEASCIAEVHLSFALAREIAVCRYLGHVV